LLFLALGLAAASLAGGAAGAEPQAGVPSGLWRTFANGDDVLALALQGKVLWAGTRAGGLVRWDPAAGTYTQFLRPQDPLAGNTVVDIALDGAGRKWLATDGGLTLFDDKGTADRGDDLWRSYTKANTFSGLPSDLVRAVAVQGDRVWVGTEQVQDPTTGAWAGGGLAQLSTNGTPDITADDVWAPVTTFEGTLKRQPDGTQKMGMVSDNVLDLLVTPKGNLWVATGPHRRLENQANPDAPKVWSRVHGGLTYRDTRGTPDPADDIWTATPCDNMQYTVTCQVQTLALDRTGFVWAGIGGRGVMYFKADEPLIIDEPARRFDASLGLGGNYVNSIAFGPAEVPALKDTVWLATSCAGTCTDRAGGLSVLNHKNTLFNKNDDVWDLDRGTPFTAGDGLARDRAQAVAVGEGMAWIGTGPALGIGGGISRLSLDSETFAANLITTCNRPGCGVPPSNFLTDIAFGKPGSRWANHVWLATGSRAAAARRFGAGAVDFDTKGTRATADDIWQQHTTVSTDADGKPPWAGLPGNNVLAIAVNGDQVWLGSTQTEWNATAKAYQDGGLALFDGARWTSRTVDTTKKGQTPGLRANGIASLATGCAGEVWVGLGSPWDFVGAGVNLLKPGTAIHDLAADTWTSYNYPELASNNTTDLAVDCAAGKVWVAAQHHISESVMGSPGGNWVGGGVAVQDVASGKWTRYDVGTGLQSYGKGTVKGEAQSVAVGPGGTAWVGAYGTKDMETATLVKQKPYWPAILNAWGGSAWTNQSFPGAGWPSSIARDAAGRLWVTTSRGGLARESYEPESWRVDRVGGGLRVFDGSAWTTLDVAASGLPSNDLSVVAVAPDGDIWVGSDGFGLARFEVGATLPTPTPDFGAPSPTPTATPSATPTETIEPTATSGSGTPSATGTLRTPGTPTAGTPGTATATRDPALSHAVYLPYTHQRRLPTPTPTATKRGTQQATPTGPTPTRTRTATRTPTSGGTPATATPNGLTATPSTTPDGSRTPTVGTPGTPATAGTPGTPGPSPSAEPEGMRIYLPFLSKPRPR
jgi:hypothetical protein